MELDHYLTLGRSGLRVSPFALGAMTFGEEGGWGSSVEESERVLQAYLDRGGNFVDTANFYTNGHSERIIGNFLAKRPGLRDRLVLASKFFGNMHPGDPNGGGAGRKAIVARLEATLRRMQTDHLDLYWLHNWDAHTPIEETMRTLDDLVTAGGSATSASRTPRRGSPRRPRRSPPCAPGRRSSHCKWSTRCSPGPWRAS
jgi:aryl-alcohol dehydrogenase-like predicted oxidoreductase